MKNCYVNPKITERDNFNVGSCFNNQKLLEYQKDMLLVNKITQDRENEIRKHFISSLKSIIFWLLIMAIIWFVLISIVE